MIRLLKTIQENGIVSKTTEGIYLISILEEVLIITTIGRSMQIKNLIDLSSIQQVVVEPKVAKAPVDD